MTAPPLWVAPLAGRHARTVERCRACYSPDLAEVLDLGWHPPANAFREPSDPEIEERYPLRLLRCQDCEFVQLSVVVEPGRLFGPHYRYRSGYSDGWAEHCHALAKQIGRGHRVLEIGCLDGVMLRHCRDNGCEVMGVDPSSPPTDLPILHEFWRRGIHLERSFDVIVGQNVFAHVEDPWEFLDAAREHLAPTGRLILECPWIVDLVLGCKWDTIYHEHMGVWGLRALGRVARRAGLAITGVEHFPEIHGGTLRYTLQRQDSNLPFDIAPSAVQIWQDEEISKDTWRDFAEHVRLHLRFWDTWFTYADDDRVGIYGASAKCNTFLNALPTSQRPTPLRPVVCFFDDNPVKQGLLSPGLRIPIVAPTAERVQALDTILIGAPNWAPAVRAKLAALGFQGEIKSLWP